jgi:hypothetical protein
MFFTIFCCISTGLTLYCILNRFNKRSMELAVHAAVHEVKKELHERHSAVIAQLTVKERELSRLRELLKLHEAIPSARVPGAPAALAASAGSRAGKKKPREGYELFEMSQPFTDTSYNALLAATEVVKVEPAGM